MENKYQQYDAYLQEHVRNVITGFEWLQMHISELFSEFDAEEVALVAMRHDASKWDEAEYDAYAEYFYGERSAEVEEMFDMAWLHHQHNNPHHWQHWLLREDEGRIKALQMPKLTILEMIADWWAFSWKNDNLYEIFNWYDQNKSKIIVNPDSREYLESTLDKLRKKLDEVHSGNKK